MAPLSSLFLSTSRTRKAPAHAAVAEAVESLRSPDDTTVAIDLAHHFRQAVPVLGAARALPHLLRAAEVALGQRSYEEGVEQLQRAAQLLQTMPESADRARQELKVQVRL